MDLSALTWKFRLGQVRVVVEPWFWLMAILLGSNFRGPEIALWIAVVFVSILVHELGHAAATYAFGGTAWIRLYSFGGLTYPSRVFSRWRSVALSLSGPFAGFALGGLAFAAQMFVPITSPTIAVTLSMLVSVNVAWGLMNLLPIPPLDGGHVLLELMGPRGERQARYAAIATAAVVVLLSLRAGMMYTVLLFGSLAYQNYAALGRSR
ncbi:MAG: site-2 protease family protein [Polyangiales bacterium]